MRTNIKSWPSDMVFFYDFDFFCEGTIDAKGSVSRATVLSEAFVFVFVYLYLLEGALRPRAVCPEPGAEASGHKP